MSDAIVHPLAPFLQPVRQLIRATLRRLPGPLAEFILFGLKMAWSCLFGAAMLGLMIVTHWVWPANAPIYRYDFLLFAALIIQGLLLWTRLETVDEVKVIFLYHVTGTVMEIFKTHMGSWAYPEGSVFHIMGVPLFTGFMYGSVGSFIARSIRVFDMRFSHYPKAWHTYVLAIVIYVNFFSHHFIWDFRYVIFGVIGVMFWRSWIYFRVDRAVRRMPFLLAGTLTAFFLWLAENIGTLTHTWAYPGAAWHMVSIQKMGAWGLLLIISFVTVTLIFKPKAPEYTPRNVSTNDLTAFDQLR
ncbi:hypothetical protein AEAC466_01590 [Asticcacaulis sp. AC466]|uniref:DUF817 domain-containing protein n=1 Tax=Asticcacaulis sp. AC466 TaxID=1282362 RepID=UPI0003C3DA09|nr:DUF817 domain-containing protein [Asticcacaulis sp. AC466]ESQ85899.1 hypothetical protein AEAC466_01590 [Asticcacaulis sp. AC466]